MRTTAFKQIKRYPELAKVLQVELRQSQRFNDYKPKKLWDYLSIFINAIEAGQSSGAFRNDIPADMLSWSSFFGSLDGLLYSGFCLIKKNDLIYINFPLIFEIFI